MFWLSYDSFPILCDVAFAKKGSFPAKIAVSEKKRKKNEHGKNESFLQNQFGQERIKKLELTSIPKIKEFRIQQPPHQEASMVKKYCPLQ